MTRPTRRIALLFVSGCAALVALVGSIALATPAAAGKPCKAACKATSSPSVSTSTATSSPKSSPTPSQLPSTSQSPSPTPTLSSTTATPTPTPTPTPTSTAPTGTNAPATQGSWVSPEGVTISVNSAGSWTIAQIYSMVKANALDLDRVGPTLTINVQDQYSSQTQTSATLYAGVYTGVKSTMWLQGVNSNFATTPDAVLTHEYGHAWSNYWYYVAHQGSWGGYLTARWTTSDGSVTLATDSRTGSSYSWTVREIIAEDYRLLFGSSTALAERPGDQNQQIPDPRNVPGLADYLRAWRTS